MATNKISLMEKKTAVALESPDPFGTPIPEPKRIDGLPVVAERKTPAKQAETRLKRQESAELAGYQRPREITV
jgi:hypothetical protein